MYIPCVILLLADRLCGYRSVVRLLRQKHHLNVSHAMVRNILRQLDPVSVANRRQRRLHRRTYTSPGPNYMWHIDGYDKLRPYGILISGLVPSFTCSLLMMGMCLLFLTLITSERVYWRWQAKTHFQAFLKVTNSVLKLYITWKHLSKQQQ